MLTFLLCSTPVSVSFPFPSSLVSSLYLCPRLLYSPTVSVFLLISSYYFYHFLPFPLLFSLLPLLPLLPLHLCFLFPVLISCSSFPCYSSLIFFPSFPFLDSSSSLTSCPPSLLLLSSSPSFRCFLVSLSLSSPCFFLSLAFLLIFCFC